MINHLLSDRTSYDRPDPSPIPVIPPTIRFSTTSRRHQIGTPWHTAATGFDRQLIRVVTIRQHPDCLFAHHVPWFTPPDEDRLGEPGSVGSHCLVSSTEFRWSEKNYPSTEKQGIGDKVCKKLNRQLYGWMKPIRNGRSRIWSNIQ